MRTHSQVLNSVFFKRLWILTTGPGNPTGPGVPAVPLSPCFGEEWLEKWINDR